jgi:hypothetical protein
LFPRRRRRRRTSLVEHENEKDHERTSGVASIREQ